jgi:acyl-CoA hydrolase
MSPHDLYVQKRVTPAEAVGVIRNGDSVIVPTGVGEPPPS